MSIRRVIERCAVLDRLHASYFLMYRYIFCYLRLAQLGSGTLRLVVQRRFKAIHGNLLVDLGSVEDRCKRLFKTCRGAGSRSSPETACGPGGGETLMAMPVAV